MQLYLHLWYRNRVRYGNICHEPHYILTKRSVKSKQRPYVSKIQNIFLTKSFWNGLLMTMILRHKRIRTNCWQHSPFVMIFLTKNSTNTTKITKIYWSNQSKKVAFHKATFLFLCKPFCMVLHFFVNYSVIQSPSFLLQ